VVMEGGVVMNHVCSIFLDIIVLVIVNDVYQLIDTNINAHLLF
jgi:hypothetical protein